MSTGTADTAASDAIAYAVSAPLSVNVAEVTLLPDQRRFARSAELL